MQKERSRKEKKVEEIYYVTKNICTSLKSAEKLVNVKEDYRKKEKMEKLYRGRKFQTMIWSKYDFAWSKERKNWDEKKKSEKDYKI